MDTVKNLAEKRAALLTDASGIVADAAAKGEALSAEAQARFDALTSEASVVASAIQSEKIAAEARAAADAAARRRLLPSPRRRSRSVTCPLSFAESPETAARLSFVTSRRRPSRRQLSRVTASGSPLVRSTRSLTLPLFPSSSSRRATSLLFHERPLSALQPQ